jgi:hypothetical protein
MEKINGRIDELCSRAGIEIKHSFTKPAKIRNQ